LIEYYRREEEMGDESLTMMFFFGSFLGAFTGAICSTAILWIVYYFWLKKSEEERLWNLAKKAGSEAIGYASSFMKSMVTEESMIDQKKDYKGFYDEHAEDDNKAFIQEESEKINL